MKVKLAAEMRELFEVEVRNERPNPGTSHGGANPATLASAKDSVMQAPEEVLAEWCGAKGNHDLLKDAVLSELRRLMLKHGGAKRLATLL